MSKLLICDGKLMTTCDGKLVTVADDWVHPNPIPDTFVMWVTATADCFVGTFENSSHLPGTPPCTISDFDFISVYSRFTANPLGNSNISYPDTTDVTPVIMTRQPPTGGNLPIDWCVWRGDLWTAKDYYGGSSRGEKGTYISSDGSCDIPLCEISNEHSYIWVRFAPCSNKILRIYMQREQATGPLYELDGDINNCTDGHKFGDVIPNNRGGWFTPCNGPCLDTQRYPGTGTVSSFRFE